MRFILSDDFYGVERARFIEFNQVGVYVGWKFRGQRYTGLGYAISCMCGMDEIGIEWL